MATSKFIRNFIYGIKAISASVFAVSAMFLAQPFVAPLSNPSAQIQAAIPGVTVKLVLLDVRKGPDGRSYKRYEYQLCVWGVCQNQGHGIDVYEDGEVREWSSNSANSAPEHNPIFDMLPEGHEIFKFAEQAKLYSEAIEETVIAQLSSQGAALDVIEQTNDILRFRPGIEGTMVFVHLSTGQEVATQPVSANQEYTLPIGSISSGGYILMIKPTSAMDKAAFRKIMIQH